MRPIGSAQGLERRRYRAIALLEEGHSQAEVARYVGVCDVSVNRWRKMADSDPNGLKAKPHRGRRLLLPQEDHPKLEQLLLKGPKAHGYTTDLWTSQRVKEVIKKHFDVDYHPEHVRKVLKKKLGWTSQKPQRSARERNEKEIELWKLNEWPRIKRSAARRGAALVFLDESGFSLTPTFRRSFAPRGKTPIIQSSARYDKVSAISAITLSPKRGREGLYFHLLPDNKNVGAEDVVGFLRQFKRHLIYPLTIVWDRSNTHDKSDLVCDFLARHPEIRTERFPGYAPELNPDEQVWTYTKYGRMANFAPTDVGHLRRRLSSELRRLSRRPDLLVSLINHSDLPLRL